MKILLSGHRRCKLRNSAKAGVSEIYLPENPAKLGKNENVQRIGENLLGELGNRYTNLNKKNKQKS